MKRIFYEHCFPTVEDLAELLFIKVKFNETKIIEVQDFRVPKRSSLIDCYDIGQQVLLGKGHVLYSSHLNNNYEWYASKTVKKYPKKEVLSFSDRELMEGC